MARESLNSDEFDVVSESIVFTVVYDFQCIQIYNTSTVIDIRLKYPACALLFFFFSNNSDIFHQFHIKIKIVPDLVPKIDTKIKYKKSYSYSHKTKSNNKILSQTNTKFHIPTNKYYNYTISSQLTKYFSSNFSPNIGYERLSSPEP